MTSMVTVDAPARAPRLGGIRTVASYVTVPRLAMGEAINYIAEPCDMPVPAIGLCYGPYSGDNAPADKTSVGIGEGTGIGPFPYYAGVECFLSTTSADEYAARARDILNQGFDRAVEYEFNVWASAHASFGGNVQTVTDAIVQAENTMDADYVGQPVIWLNRGNAIIAAAAQAIFPTLNGGLITANGTPVVASGKIDFATVFATGSITVLETDEQDISAPSPTVNRDWAIAERVFGLVIDCGLALRYPIIGTN
jgi:hypothetical protein